MCCRARSQASPSERPALKHETVQVVVAPCASTGTTTTASAFSHPGKPFRSSTMSRSICSFVIGNLLICRPGMGMLRRLWCRRILVVRLLRCERATHCLVLIVGYPLRVGCKRDEADLELPILARFVRAARC